MKIIVLSDNRSKDKSLETEHGLSIYLETDKHKCLLDTGASDLFIRNAEKLGVDLSEIDYVFISHGHADHIGGLPAFLEINSKARIVLSKHALTQQFYSKRIGMRSISISLEPKNYPGRFIFVDHQLQIEEDIQILRVSSELFPLPKGNGNLYKNAGCGLELDDFNHEIVVCFGTKELLVYTGCAHKGLLNILHFVQQTLQKPIQLVVGGFHLTENSENQATETEDDVQNLAVQLKEMWPNTHFITGHCTCSASFSTLQSVLNSNLNIFHVAYQTNFKTN